MTSLLLLANVSLQVWESQQGSLSCQRLNPSGLWQALRMRKKTALTLFPTRRQW